jgi:hypothetical protein
VCELTRLFRTHSQSLQSVAGIVDYLLGDTILLGVVQRTLRTHNIWTIKFSTFYRPYSIWTINFIVHILYVKSTLSSIYYMDDRLRNHLLYKLEYFSTEASTLQRTLRGRGMYTVGYSDFPAKDQVHKHFPNRARILVALIQIKPFEAIVFERQSILSLHYPKI